MTTPQTYQADDDQQVPDPDVAVAEDSSMEPVAALAEQSIGLTAPDAALPESGLAAMAPVADQIGNEDSPPDPASAVAPGPEPVTSTASDYPGFTPEADGGAEEPLMADSSPGSPVLVSVAFSAPETVTDSHPTGKPASADGPWNAIQAMFVDDPRASVERAMGLVDDRVEELFQSVRERQRSMQAGWQAKYAETEELRIALQHYRTFWNSLEDLPAQA